MPGWLSDLWYDVAWYSSYVTFLLGWSLRTEGSRHVPRTGPALLIANHQSFFDPLLIGVAARRRLVYLARQSLYRNRAVGSLFRSYPIVPIDHEGVGKDGLKIILGQLALGRPVLVFPEGERTRDGVMHPLRPGIFLLIKRVQAPIVPMGIAGAFGAWPKTRPAPTFAPLFLPPGPGTMAVSVGRPLDGRRYATMAREQALNELFAALQRQEKRAEQLRRT